MKLVCLSLILASVLSSPVFAQTAILRGHVTDESGAVVPGAKIVLTGPTGLSKTTSAANEGSYSFTDLPPGGYTVQASAPSLILRQPANISLKAGTQTLNLSLNVAAEKQQVTVADNGAPTVSTDAANNASASCYDRVSVWSFRRNAEQAFFVRRKKLSNQSCNCTATDWGSVAVMRPPDTEEWRPEAGVMQSSPLFENVRRTAVLPVVK